MVASLPGDYWVVLNAQPATDREPLDIPVTLTVQVRGEQGGAPPYPEHRDRTRRLPAAGRLRRRHPVPGRRRVVLRRPVRQPTTGHGDDHDGFGPRRIGGAALLVVSLALCVVGALRLRRRPV